MRRIIIIVAIMLIPGCALKEVKNDPNKYDRTWD